jgi:hypothetical protein
MSDIGTFGMLPGIGNLYESNEVQLWFGKAEQQLFGGDTVGASAVDAGNSPTTVLRQGNVMGRKTSDGKLYPYSAANTDGTEIAVCVLNQSLSMLNAVGDAEDKQVQTIQVGSLKSENLVGLDSVARDQLTSSGRFIFDDDSSNHANTLGHSIHEVAKTANYTVVSADNGTLFTNTGATGAVTFTLPAVATSEGQSFEFLATVAQNVEVASAEGTNIVWDGNAGRSSLTFSTSSHIIGGHLLFSANAAGTLWYVRNYSPATSTVTAA